MFTKEQLKERFENNSNSDSRKYFVDVNTLSKYLKTWRIDPVYEDEDKTEYFDESALLKLNKGIELKEQGISDEEILLMLSTEVMNHIKVPELKHTEIASMDNMTGSEIKKLTVDVTSHTISVLADTLSQKISKDIADKLQSSDLLEPILEAGKLRRDNEVLAAQIERLLEENKKLISKVNYLKKENAKFTHLFGTLYIKQ